MFVIKNVALTRTLHKCTCLQTERTLPVNPARSISETRKNMLKNIAQVVRKILVIRNLDQPVVHKITHDVFDRSPQGPGNLRKLLVKVVRHWGCLGRPADSNLRRMNQLTRTNRTSRHRTGRTRPSAERSHSSIDWLSKLKFFATEAESRSIGSESSKSLTFPGFFGSEREAEQDSYAGRLHIV